MAWAVPRTWVAGELVTAAIMNTHVRDNFVAARGSIRGVPHQLGGDYTFQQTDAAFTVIAGSVLAEVNGTDLGMVEAHCMAKVDAGTGQIRLFNVTTVAAIGAAVTVTELVDTLKKITGLTLTAGANSYRLEALRGTTWIKVWGGRLLVF